jgi:hypothetical protein
VIRARARRRLPNGKPKTGHAPVILDRHPKLAQMYFYIFLLSSVKSTHNLTFSTKWERVRRFGSGRFKVYSTYATMVIYLKAPRPYESIDGKAGATLIRKNGDLPRKYCNKNSSLNYTITNKIGCNILKEIMLQNVVNNILWVQIDLQQKSPIILTKMKNEDNKNHVLAAIKNG